MASWHHHQWRQRNGSSNHRVENISGRQKRLISMACIVTKLGISENINGVMAAKASAAAASGVKACGGVNGRNGGVAARNGVSDNLMA